MSQEEKSAIASNVFAYGWIGQGGDSAYYCVKYFPFHIALRFEEGKWVEIPFEEFPKGVKPMESEKIQTVFGDNLPHRLIKEIDIRRAKEADENWVELGKKAGRRIIGWAKRAEDHVDLIESDASTDAAIILDFQEHGYFLTWEDIMERELRPVFDTYETVLYDMRDFGYLVAVSQGDHTPFSYMDYVFAGDVPDEQLVAPKEGLYADIEKAPQHIFLDEEEFDLVLQAKEKPCKKPLFFLFPAEKTAGASYFPKDEIEVEAKQSKRSLVLPLFLIIPSPRDGHNIRDLKANDHYLLSKNVVQDENHVILGLLLTGTISE